MSAAGHSASPPRASPWLQSGERSNRTALRLMAWVATRLGRRVARLVLVPVTLYFLCFAPGPRRQSARYLQRVLGRPPTLAERFGHFHAFASVALDRIWFARGQLQHFEINVSGGPLVDDTLAAGRGAFFLGAHLGSFEALHAIGATRPGMRVAHVMYPDNARMIHEVLAAIAPGFALGIIPIGRSGSTLEIRDWLDGGGLVGLMGDRWVASASSVSVPAQSLSGPPVAATDAVEKTGARSGFVSIDFLGHPAPFIDGPLRLALLLRRRVLFMAGLYRGGNRYDLRFELLADFTNAPRDAAERERLLQQALRAYVSRLEALCTEAPLNWFNFYDFWKR
ncbi:MAG: acyl-CoA synthetase [Rubrivivax sp.]